MNCEHNRDSLVDKGDGTTYCWQCEARLRQLITVNEQAIEKLQAEFGPAAQGAIHRNREAIRKLRQHTVNTVEASR